jgi:serum/glucocorticoid-regulated kinase 2
VIFDNISLKPSFIKNLKNNVSMSDFKFVKCLGSGGFSVVYLVKGNFDGKYYALKLINKKFIIDS